LGPLYAGDEAHLVLLRNDQRVEVKVVLTDKLLPYEHPFLGILPKRTASAEGVVVRFVYPDGPASKADIVIGDKILGLSDERIGGADLLRERLASLKPGQEVELLLDRQGESLTRRVVLGTLPTAVPESPPPAKSLTPAEGENVQPALGKLDISIPEESNDCIAYVPINYDPRVPHGLLVWLHPPGKPQFDELVGQWKELCDEYQVILLAPGASDAARWLPTDAAFVRKTIEHILAHYNVDRNRIVTHGYQAGGGMAYVVAFLHRDLIRGVAAVDSPVPARAPLPLSDPLERLAVLTAVAKSSPMFRRVQDDVERFESQKIPVTLKLLDESSEPLDAPLRGEVIRWLDTLDRI
jgi:serine protease Do